MKNAKFAFVSFFEVFPINFGSSVVCGSLYKNWPFKKKYFQLSNKRSTKKIQNISYIENSIGKLLSIPHLFFSLKKYLNAKKNIVLIEGVSWIGYSFVLLLLIKIFIKNTRIVYKSHSIEYEIRKKNNNFIIYNLSKYFEKKVFELSDLSTSVSINEKKKIYKYYRAKTFLFFNTIEFSQKKTFKKNNKNFIIFSGSYEYKPNAYSIDQLIKFIMPNLHKIEPDIKLLILGNENLEYTEPWLKFEKVSKNKYLNYLSNAIAIVIPSNESYGSKVKIIEALCYGTPVITTKTGFTGINIINKLQPSIESNNKSIIKKIIKIKNSRDKYYQAAKNVKKHYIRMHDINLNIKRFIKRLESL